MKKTLLLLIAVLSPLASAQDIAITNGTVLTITNGVIDRGTVLIRGSKIAAVGPSASVTVPSGATIVDATGKFVMPGIVDSHSHTAVDGSVNEVSLPNTGMVRVADAMTADDISAYRQLAGGTTAALVLHG